MRKQSSSSAESEVHSLTLPNKRIKQAGVCRGLYGFYFLFGLNISKNNYLT
jgi:hypothetical protein